MSRPSTVFVAGSRQISRLPAEVKARLDTIVETGFQILVGDANGADKAVQHYRADKSYPNVLVHCMKDHCRNNIGNWPTREVPRGVQGFDYYSLKDRAMAEAAEYGLMPLERQEQGHRQQRREPVTRAQADRRHVASTKRFRRINPSAISKIFSRKVIRTAWSECQRTAPECCSAPGRGLVAPVRPAPRIRV